MVNFPDGGHQPKRWGWQPIILKIFLQKLYEIEKKMKLPGEAAIPATLSSVCKYPLGMGLDLIPLDFPLGYGPGPDPPQFPPWVWAWRAPPGADPPRSSHSPGAATPREQAPPRKQAPPGLGIPPVNRMTDACENIT